METDKIIASLRDKKGLSQTDRARVYRVIIGKCERGEALPSIDAKKIADALGVSLDDLVGEGINSKFDKQVKRLQDLEYNFYPTSAEATAGKTKIRIVTNAKGSVVFVEPFLPPPASATP